MWDEEDRRRRLRREMMGGEEPSFGSFDASGQYVGLTPPMPGWFSSTLFPNAWRYGQDRTSEAVERFLRGPVGESSPRTKPNEVHVATERAGMSWLTPQGDVLWLVPGQPPDAMLAKLPQGFMPEDLRLAGLAVAPPLPNRSAGEGLQGLVLTPTPDVVNDVGPLVGTLGPGRDKGVRVALN